MPASVFFLFIRPICVIAALVFWINWKLHENHSQLLGKNVQLVSRRWKQSDEVVVLLRGRRPSSQMKEQRHLKEPSRASHGPHSLKNHPQTPVKGNPS